MKLLAKILVALVSMAVTLPSTLAFTAYCIDAQKDYCDPIYGILMYPVIWMGAALLVYSIVVRTGKSIINFIKK